MAVDRVAEVRRDSVQEREWAVSDGEDTIVGDGFSLWDGNKVPFRLLMKPTYSMRDVIWSLGSWHCRCVHYGQPCILCLY